MPLPKPKSDFSVSASKRVLLGLGVLAGTFGLMTCNALAEGSAHAPSTTTVAESTTPASQPGLSRLDLNKDLGNVKIVPNTDDAAITAVKHNKDKLVVAIVYGTKPRYKPATLEERLTDLARAHGSRDNVEFFLQPGRGPNTVFGLYYDEMVQRPVKLDEIVDETKRAARYLAIENGRYIPGQ